MHTLHHVLRNRNLVSAPPSACVYDVALLMVRSKCGALPILEAEQLVGVFSERDLMARVVVPELDPKETPVGQVMTRDVVTADIEDRTGPCLDKMRLAGCRHLPILADGRVIAMLSMRDILTDEIEEQHAEIVNLRAYLHQEGPL
ncbi:MAG: CBS domain-containing protein [Proteobacteria bacterium]|nr:CBS domain-containing protein [Pseudomonadota bacterium]